MKDGFNAVFDKNSRLLILGSFPSVLSFQNGFYYGNPRNRFWGLIQEVFAESISSIDEKKQLLLKHNIALWDIVAGGENLKEGRENSSDSNLKCEKVADIDWIINQTKINKIICNGKKAYELFCNHYPHLIDIAVCLPSTSPANVRFDKDLWLNELEQMQVQ